MTWYSMFIFFIYILNNNTNNVSVMVTMSVYVALPYDLQTFFLYIFV